MFYVTFTPTGQGTATADKTQEEIYNAYQSGRQVIGRILAGDTYLFIRMSAIGESGSEFVVIDLTANEVSKTKFMMAQDGNVTITGTVATIPSE